MTEIWPATLLRPRQITRQLLARTTSGTVAVSGFTQRVSVPASAWSITYEGIVVGTAAQLRAWDALEAALDGGAGSVLVPLIGEVGPGAATGIVLGAAAVGATLLTIRVTPGPLLAGHHFTTGPRLYRVVEVLSVVGDDYGISIRPPLRDAIADLDGVEFDAPSAKCRLASDDAMTLSLDPARHGVGAVRFVEDPT